MKELLTLATENIAGDPDTWPEAFAWTGVAFAVAGIVIAWFKWGRAAYNEEDRIRNDSWSSKPTIWTYSRTETTTKPQPDTLTKEGDAPDA